MRIARVAKYFFIFLEPAIHRLPVKRHVTGQRAGFVIGGFVAPNQILSGFAAGFQRPIGGVSLERTVGIMRRFFAKLRAEILLGKIIDRDIGALEKQFGGLAVDDRLTAEGHPHPLVAR